MIDWSHVAILRDEIGAEEFDEVVDIFLEEVDEAIGRLRDNVNVSGLEAALHSLKGSALNLGFVDFSALCQAGETLSAAGSAQEVDIEKLVQSYDASRKTFIDNLQTAFMA